MGFLRRPSAPTAMGLAMGIELAVEAAFRPDIKVLIGKDRHHLARRKCREIRLVADEQDALACLVAQAIRDPAVAAFAATQSVPITRELSPASLQRGQTHTHQRGHPLGELSGCHGGIKDLQHLAAILRCAQYPLSSSK